MNWLPPTMGSGPMVSRPEMARERRRRAGSRQLSVKWAEYAANALRGYIGRSRFFLPDEIIQRIRRYVVRLREECYHYFLRCPVCGFRRCPICGQKFLYAPPDPPPCTCVRRPRRSRRLAALIEEYGTGLPSPTVTPLHAAFPLVYAPE